MKVRTLALVATLIAAAGCAGDDADEAAQGLEPAVSRPAAAPTDQDDLAQSLSGVAGAPESTAGAEATEPSPVDANPIVEADDDALSTFAMDVDTGSYTYARAALRNGQLPDPTVVRTEEFVNYLGQGYEQPVDTFAVTVDGTMVPFLSSDSSVVRVGIQGWDLPRSQRDQANLTFVIDISGSMEEPGKLDAVKPALAALVDALGPDDQVAIVVYSEDTRVVLDPTPVADDEVILDAIESLRTEGSTNVEAGLELGYEVAQDSFEADRINRVVLLSDGVANVDSTTAGAILDEVDDRARDGIDLVTVGFGLGDYNDTLMEQLADRGDGFYAYVDDQAEAERLFSQDLVGTIATIARDAKVQVEFNPDAVESYRLVGYENRDLADEDFRDDRVDGGEVGAGHTVTALYEVTFVEGRLGQTDWLARVALRWIDPETSGPRELYQELDDRDLAESLGSAPLRLQQDVYAAVFAETLRGSGWDGQHSLSTLSTNLHALADRLEDPRTAELAELVDLARDL